MASKKNTVAILTQAKKPTVEAIVKVIKAGQASIVVDQKMTEIIKADLYTRNKRTGVSVLTTELNKVFSDGTDLEITKTKKWVKTRLQTLIKEKSVQTQLLGEDKKVKSLTIKKVNLPMLDPNNEKCLSHFKDSDLGQFRVILEAKVTVENSFTEELEKLMIKHDRCADDLVNYATAVLSPQQIMDIVESN